MRVLGTFVFGIGMLFRGWYLKDKKTNYAMILQGGALGIIYITVFAAFKLYDLIPYLLALVALIIICGLCVYMALVQRTKSLAIFACIGGYLTPVLLSSLSINHTALKPCKECVLFIFIKSFHYSLPRYSIFGNFEISILNFCFC